MIGKFAYLVHFPCNLHWILIWLDMLGCFGAGLVALDSQLLLEISCLACWKFCLKVLQIQSDCFLIWEFISRNFCKLFQWVILQDISFHLIYCVP